MMSSLAPRLCMANHEPSMSEATPLILGALALELAPGSSAGRDALPQREAGALAALMARDLAQFEPDAATLELTTVGAHYDPVELLRPGWPIHRELARLGARAPAEAAAGTAMAAMGDGNRGHGRSRNDIQRVQASPGRIVAFGSHDQRLPGALAASADHAGGPLRLLPWRLDGESAVVRRLGAAFEGDLMECGMAGADTALLAQEAFGLRVEHARYLTLHDLCALMAMQYQHAGLAPLWPLLETALLSPEREAWLDAPPEPLLHYAEREVRIALLSPDAWRARNATDDAKETDDDGERLQRGFAQFEGRQRQFAAVLMAHGVPVTFAHCRGDPADL